MIYSVFYFLQKQKRERKWNFSNEQIFFLWIWCDRVSNRFDSNADATKRISSTVPLRINLPYLIKHTTRTHTHILEIISFLFLWISIRNHSGFSKCSSELNTFWLNWYLNLKMNFAEIVHTNAIETTQQMKLNRSSALFEIHISI